MKVFKKVEVLLQKLTSSHYALLYLYFIAFLEASLSPVLPEAYIALLALYRKEYTWQKLSLVSAYGSASGGFFMYSIGRYFYSDFGVKLLSLLHGEKTFALAETFFRHYPFLTQFVASFTPLDRVFSLFAGMFSVNLFLFCTALFMGRFVRASLTAYFFSLYGDQGKEYVKRHMKKFLFALACALTLYVALKVVAILH
jgi:membrane protein YqaA with SNARE-associated domain